MWHPAILRYSMDVLPMEYWKVLRPHGWTAAASRDSVYP